MILDGTDTQVANSWASFTNGILDITGGSLTLPNLTDFTGSSLSLSGGASLSLPVLAKGNLSLANGTSVTVRSTLVAMPTDGSSGAVINVPQTPGVTFTLRNSGTLTGTTIIVGQDTNVVISGGTYNGGVTFNVASGATVDLTGGGNITYGGTLAGSGGGTVQYTGGLLFPEIGGMTLNFPGSMFQWTGGGFDSTSGDVTNLGTMNLAGPNNKLFYAAGTLDNFGTIAQTGTGYLVMFSNLPDILKNEPGGTYLMESDAGITYASSAGEVINNAGTIRKTAGTGTSFIYANGTLINTGTIEADSGTLDLEPNSFAQLSGNTLTGGTWNAMDGAALKFPSGTSITTNAANITLSGAGATIAALANLATNSGSLTLGPAATLTVAGSFTQTSDGTLNIQIGGTPSSGLFGQLNVTAAATLAGTFNLDLVNGFAATSGQSFEVMSFASVSGTFSTFNGLSPNFTETLNPTSLVLSVTANPVDLLPTGVTAPTSATAGQAVTVGWQVANQSSQDAIGDWLDSVYVSATPTITSSSVLLGEVQHNGGLAASGTYSSSLTAALPALSPGFYYVLVQVDSHFQVPDTDRANNTLAATTGQIQVSVPALTLGVASNGAFTAADQDQYYQVTVPAGGTLQVSLASAAASGSLALYVNQGILPTPYSFQEAANIANQPNPTVTVPQIPTAGTYYILVHSVSGAAATAGYTLTASQTTSLSVTGLGATSGGNGGNMTIEIDGANFLPTAAATLTLGGTTITASTVDFVSASQLFATFNVTGATAGSYTLAVKQGAQSATAPTTFQVVAASPGSLNVTLTTPQYIRSGRTGTIVITYTNPTNNDMVAPLLNVSSANPLVSFSTPDNPNNFSQFTEVLAVAPSGPAGILRPGQSGQLTLNLLSSDTVNGDQLPVDVQQNIAGKTINWAAQQASLQPANVSTATWNVIFANLLAVLGTTTDALNAALAQAATYLSNLGDTATEVSDVTALWSFLVAQANDVFPTPSLTTAVDASLKVPGSVPLAVTRRFMSSIAGRDQKGIFGLGWTSPLQSSLTTDSAGNVFVNIGGSVGYFAVQPNGDYLTTDSDFGTLSAPAGVFTLTDASGTQRVYLPNGLLNFTQDTNGNRVTLGYNAQNQVVTLTYSNPSVPSEPSEELTLSYNAQGFVSQAADGTGNLWAYAYDAAGHLLSVTAPGNLVTGYAYDTGSNAETANALLSITNPDGSQQNYAYDPATGRLTGDSQSGGTLTAQGSFSYSYPGEGEVIATDQANNQTIVWFNDFGQPGRVQDFGGAVSTFLYDANGNLVQYTNAAGNSYQYAYDVNNNLTQVVNPLGQTINMTYGADSRLSTMTDAAGSTTRYNYGSTGNLLGVTYPDGTRQAFTYDPLGNLSDTVLQNGDPVSYQVNSEGLVTKETFADGTSQTFAYDGHGNMLTANTFNAANTLTGTTTLTYNAANQLLSIAYPDGRSLAFTYNAAGQRTKSVDQDGFTINYGYDGLGRLSNLTDGSNNTIVQYTYNSLGELQQKLNGNGTYSTYAYDANGNLTGEVNLTAANAVNSSFAYTYNAMGQQTSMTDAAGNVTSYGYDAIGQLTEVTLPGGTTITYVYNANGDRTEVIDGGTPTSYSSNAANEITQVGAATYAYDANGNLHTVTDGSGTTTYTYNDMNQLVSIAAPGGSTTTFQYSPLGFLVGTNAAGTQTNYLVDPTGLGNVVASYDGGGSLIANYTYGLGLVSQTGPSGTGYYDFDGSGNTVGITDSTGSYVNQYGYLPFGETTTASAALPNPFTFAGLSGVMQLGSDLFGMRARDYTPATGQFMSNDPLNTGGGDVNLRRYAVNDPTNVQDPSGLCSQFFGFSGGLGVSGTVGFTVNDNGDLFLTTGFGGTSGGVTIYSASTGNASEGDSVEYSGTIGGGMLGVTAHNSLDNSGYSGSGSVDVGFSVPGFSVNHFTNGKVGNLNDLLNAMNGGQGNGGSGSGGGGGGCGGSGSSSGQGGGGGGGGSGSSGNATSHDPNALIGPAGAGTQGFIQPVGNWPYTALFENDGSVAAQDVTVTQQLDSNLDWSTFQLGSFGFGSVNVVIPAGLTQYQTTVAYQNSDGSTLDVLVDLDFNVETGLLIVTFTSLDPATGQAPTGVFDGFLPPDNSSHAGEGFVQYTVQPKATLATGATVTQQASIVFDTNAPLATNIVLNTIDATPPVDTTPPTTYNAVEGNSTGTQVVATFTDAAPGAATTDFSGSIDWGDGTGAAAFTSADVSLASGTFSVSQSHVYAEEGTYHVTVTITDADGVSATATNTTVVVGDAPLTDTTATKTYNVTADKSTGSQVLATFTDGNPSAPLSDFTPTVNWGGTLIAAPGVSVAFVSSTATASTWEVLGSAVYAAPGTYPISVNVQDAGGSSVASSGKIQFTAATALLTDTTPKKTFSAVEGNSTKTQVLATFTDANAKAQPGNFTATVTWNGTLIGTPTVSVKLVSRTKKVSKWEVVGSATYADAGTYGAAVLVEDTAGNELLSSGKTQFKVADAPLHDVTKAKTYKTVAGTGTGTQVLAMFTDANPYAPVGDFHATVNWVGAVTGTPTVSVQFVSSTQTLSTWEVLASATYSKAGTYAVKVTVTDVDGKSVNTSKTTFKVAAAASPAKVAATAAVLGVAASPVLHSGPPAPAVNDAALAAVLSEWAPSSGSSPAMDASKDTSKRLADLLAFLP